MIKKVLLFALLILSFSSIAQKAQRIGYIDMEYILENIPEYNEAQSKLNSKVVTWQSNIDVIKKDIESLKTELNIEKALLTTELILEKEEDIQIKSFELKQLQDSYFGTEGDLFVLRQQLVQPVQDLVYNAIQEIAVKRKYDFVFDKSSNLIMLYSNNQFDISELVINSITKTKKIEDIKEKRAGGSTNNEIDDTDEISTVKNENVTKAIDDREAKKLELQQKIEAKRAEQLKKREELKKAIEEKRQKRIKEIEDAKKAKEEKNKNN